MLDKLCRSKASGLDGPHRQGWHLELSIQLPDADPARGQIVALAELNVPRAQGRHVPRAIDLRPRNHPLAGSSVLVVEVERAALLIVIQDREQVVWACRNDMLARGRWTSALKEAVISLDIDRFGRIGSQCNSVTLFDIVYVADEMSIIAFNLRFV